MSKAKSIYQVFEETAKKNPGKTALIYLGEKYSYQYLMDAAARMARAFKDLGLKKGDRAIIYIPNCPQWLAAWLGLQRMGAAAVPVSPIYTVHDLKYIAEDSRARLILCGDTNYGYAKKLKEAGVLDTIIVTNIADALPWWKRMIGVGFDRIPEGKVDTADVHWYRALIRGAKDESPPVDCEPEEYLEVLYTGGTTKFPKGVPICHRVYCESFLAQLKVSDPLVPMNQNVIVQGAPLFHVLGQLFGLGPICLAGATVILLPKVNLDAMMLYVQRYKAKTLFGVPTLYRMILEHDRRDFYDLSSLKYCFTGGDVLPMEVLRRWRDHYGSRIYQDTGPPKPAAG